MSPALMDAPALLFAVDRRDAGPRRTLEDLLDSRWRRARATGSTECPVCSAPMHAHTTQATCSTCGSTLS